MPAMRPRRAKTDATPPESVTTREIVLRRGGRTPRIVTVDGATHEYQVWVDGLPYHHVADDDLGRWIYVRTR